MQHLKRCLQINQQPDGDFDNLLAGAYFRMGDKNNAIAWYLQSLRAALPSAQAYPNLCYLLSSSDDWTQLLTISITASKVYPQNPAFGFYEAQALSHLNRLPEAIRLLERLATLSASDQFHASYELSLLYAQEKDRQDSLKYAQNFIFTVATQQPQLRDECMEIGNLALNFSDYRTASQGYEQALRAEPSNVTAHNQLVICYQKLGLLEQAKEQETLIKEFGGSAQ